MVLIRQEKSSVLVTVVRITAMACLATVVVFQFVTIKDLLEPTTPVVGSSSATNSGQAAVSLDDQSLLRNTKVTSDWPGQPTRQLGSSPDDNKLVRIGEGGPVQGARGFFLQHLDEFLKVYQERPDKSNTCGIRFTHSLAVYTVAKRLQPTTIIESGVNSGQSTYFFRKACPQAKIISIDPLEEPICGQPVRWIDNTNNEYITGKDFVDFDEVNWQERIAKGELDPATSLVFMDDHRGFYKRFGTFLRFGFRHVMNEDNYKMGEGATPRDKNGFAPKQMFTRPSNAETQWLFHNSKIYMEFPPLLPPVMSKMYPKPKKVQGGFLHNTDDLTAIEEPLLRPDTSEADKRVFERIVKELELDSTLVEPQSYQELMGYCFICYMELVPVPPSLRAALKL